MNNAKDYCDCLVSWEVQDNRKLSSVVHCTFVPNRHDKSIDGDITGSLYTKSTEENEMDFTPIIVMPFLHPELTKASFCDLKIFVSPKLGIKLDRIVVISTAKVAEFFDRSGELLYSVKGEKVVAKSDNKKEDGVGSSGITGSTGDVNNNNNNNNNQKLLTKWFRKEYIPSVDTFEIQIRFSEHHVSTELMIKYIEVGIVSFNWSPEFPSTLTSTMSGGVGAGGQVLNSASLSSIHNSSSPSRSNTVGGGSGTPQNSGTGMPSVIHTSSSFGTGINLASSSGAIDVRSEKVSEAINTLNSLVQLLSTEVRQVCKGSSPQLSTNACTNSNVWTDSSLHNKQKKTNTLTSSSSSYNSQSTAPVKDKEPSSGSPQHQGTSIEPQLASLKSLQTWLDNRLTQLENNTITKLDQLATRIDRIETLLPAGSDLDQNNTAVSSPDQPDNKEPSVCSEPGSTSATPDSCLPNQNQP